MSENNVLTEDNLKELHRIGSGIRAQLDSHFEQWGSGLLFRILLSKYGVRAKPMGLDASSLGIELQKMGYIKLFSTPNGKRTVYSSNCPLSDEEIKAQLQEAEIVEAANKKADKLHR